MGEVVSRIRLAKLWYGEARSLSGILLPRPKTSPHQDIDHTSCAAVTGASKSLVSAQDLSRPSSSLESPLLQLQQQLLPNILIPWTPTTCDVSVDNSGYSDHESASSSSYSQLGIVGSTQSRRPSSQALVGYTLEGSIIGFWRLDPQIYDILKSLQQVLATHHESRPVLGGASHQRYRGAGGGGLPNATMSSFHSIDGDLIDRFLGLDHTVQIEVMDRAIRLEGMVEEWIRRRGAHSDNGDSGGSDLTAVLDRTFKTTTSCCKDPAGCAKRAKARRSKYLDEKGRPKRGDYREAAVEMSTDMHRADGGDKGDLGHGRTYNGDTRPVDVSHVPCRAIHVLCCILHFLRNLDWHQK